MSRFSESISKNKTSNFRKRISGEPTTFVDTILSEAEKKRKENEGITTQEKLTQAQSSFQTMEQKNLSGRQRRQEYLAKAEVERAEELQKEEEKKKGTVLGKIGYGIESVYDKLAGTPDVSDGKKDTLSNILAGKTQKPTYEKVAEDLAVGTVQLTTGLTNAARILNKPVDFLAGELEKLATGKKSESLIDRVLLEQVQAGEQFIKEKQIPETSGLFETAGRKITRQVPQLILPLAGAGKLSTLGTLGASSFGSGARQAEQEGATLGQQVAAGVGKAGLEVATEYIPISKLQTILRGTPTSKDVITEVVSETLGEALSEALSPAIEQVYNESAVKEAYVEDTANTVKGIIEAGLTGGALALLVSGASLKLSSVDTAIENPTQENLQQVADDIQAKTGVDVVAEKGINLQAEANKPNINKMSANEIKQELTSMGMDSTGTASEVRNRLKSALQEEVATTTKPETTSAFKQAIAPAKKSAFKMSIEDLKAQSQQVDTVLAETEAGTVENQIVTQAKSLIDNVSNENLQDTITKLKELNNQAEQRGIPMNLQLFAEIKSDIYAIEDTGAVAPAILKKYQKVIDEFENKGITKATTQEFQKLIEIKNSIAEIKAKNAEKIAEVKNRYAMKEQARKESGIRSKLLKEASKLQRGRLQPEFKAIADEMFGNIDTVAKSVSSKKLIELNEVSKQIEQMQLDGIDVPKEMTDAVSRLSRKQISDMEIDEVNQLLDLAKYIQHANATKNKTLATERQENIDSIRNGMIQDLDVKPSRKAKKFLETGKFSENHKLMGLVDLFVGRPANTFKTLMYELGRANPNSWAVKLGNYVSDRANIELENRDNLNGLLDKYMEDYKKLASSSGWNLDQNVNGRTLTSGEKVYLKLATRDANVLKSLEQRGYRRKGEGEAKTINKAEIDAIELSKDEQKAFDAATEFFDSTYDLLNEAYLIKNGYELFTQGSGNYIPKRTSDITLREELGNMDKPGGIANTGAVQERTGAINELLLPDIMDVYSRQLDIASKYNAYTNMVADVSKVFNSPTLRAKLRAEYGVDPSGKSIVESYINDLFQDLQGTKQARDSKGEKALKYIRTKAAPAILAYRLTTPMLQTASYPMALTEINPSNLALGLTQPNGFDEAAQNNRRAKARTEGRIDRDLAESNVNKFVEFGLKPIQFMDKKTIGALWNATKLQVQQETGLDGDSLLKATSNRFDRVLDTQPNYTTADRSMTMRSNSEVDKALTMFSSAKSSVLNELKRGYIQGKYQGDWSQLSKAMSGLTISVLMMSTISNLLKKAKGDDEEYQETLINRLGGALPGLDIVSSMINGYGVSNVGIDVIEDIAKASTKAIDLMTDLATGEDIPESRVVNTTWDTLEAISLGLGIPLETLKTDLQTVGSLVPDSALQTNVKRVFDPYNKTEYYKEINKAVDKRDEKKLKSLLNIMDTVDVKEENVLKRFDNKDERFIKNLLP